MENPIKEYEEKTNLKKPLAKRVLDLTKRYSDPCPLGTFISDKMKELGNTDIAFHSTGFTMYPLKLEDSNIVTMYDLKRVMCDSMATIKKININSEQLIKVFSNATSSRMYKDRGNSQFLQCSQNITIYGHGNSKNNTYKITQIEINNEKLLDEYGNVKDPNKTYSCTIDSFIGNGGQGYDILKNIPQIEVLKNGEKIKINDLFYQSIKQAPENYSTPQYPSFKIEDNIK